MKKKGEKGEVAGPKLSLSFIGYLNRTGAKALKSKTHFPLEITGGETRSWPNLDPLPPGEQEDRHIQAQMDETPQLPPTL